MQQQHQRRAALAGNEGIEGQAAGGSGDLFECGHERHFLNLPGGIMPAHHRADWIDIVKEDCSSGGMSTKKGRIIGVSWIKAQSLIYPAQAAELANGTGQIGVFT